VIGGREKKEEEEEEEEEGMSGFGKENWIDHKHEYYFHYYYSP